MPHTHFESFLSRVNDEVQRNRVAKRRPSGRIDIAPVKAAMLNDHVIYTVADGHRYFWMMGPEGGPHPMTASGGKQSSASREPGRGAARASLTANAPETTLIPAGLR
jgi:hypothetical protein